MSAVTTRAIGAPLDRIDGPEKVTGTARYAFEQPVENPAYLYPLEATIATGRVTAIDVDGAVAVPGVVAVLTHENAPKLASLRWRELRDPAVRRDRTSAASSWSGVIAETLRDRAPGGASLVGSDTTSEHHSVEMRSDDSDLYKPDYAQRRSTKPTRPRGESSALALAKAQPRSIIPIRHRRSTTIRLELTRDDRECGADEGVTLY